MAKGLCCAPSGDVQINAKKHAGQKYIRVNGMLATAEIPNALYRALKFRAARKQRWVKEMILRGIELRLRVKNYTCRAARQEAFLLRSSALQAGSVFAQAIEKHEQENGDEGVYRCGDEQLPVEPSLWLRQKHAAG